MLAHRLLKKHQLLFIEPGENLLVFHCMHDASNRLGALACARGRLWARCRRGLGGLAIPTAALSWTTAHGEGELLLLAFRRKRVQRHHLDKLIGRQGGAHCSGLGDARRLTGRLLQQLDFPEEVAGLQLTLHSRWPCSGLLDCPVAEQIEERLRGHVAGPRDDSALLEDARGQRICEQPAVVVAKVACKDADRLQERHPRSPLLLDFVADRAHEEPASHHKQNQLVRRRRDRRGSRVAGQEGELATRVARAQLLSQDRASLIHHHLACARLDQVEVVALVALAHDDLPPFDLDLGRCIHKGTSFPVVEVGAQQRVGRHLVIRAFCGDQLCCSSGGYGESE
mmetsp:Transcript_8398/g.26042  ORF Transcript_8398/g.26042 Transcript_8398/m.26042 type:complete len:340 (+) Transcript_8398:2431-3450(+)